MYSSGKSGSGEYVAATPNDQYVQMKSQDYNRWSYFDDYNAYDAYYAPSPMYGAGFGYGFGAPCYGFGYSPFAGPSFGLGLGFGDPYLMWDSYFIWNSWYNPYFYNPYYGGGAVVVGKNPTSLYTNLRPFNTSNYHSGLAHYGASSSRNVVYRPGMSTTTAYNSRFTSRNRSTFRPAYNNNNSFRNNSFRNSSFRNNGPFRSAAPTRTYSPPTRSFTPSFNGGGGGFRGGSVGGHH
jgi:hypothetical protein